LVVNLFSDVICKSLFAHFCGSVYEFSLTRANHFSRPKKLPQQKNSRGRDLKKYFHDQQKHFENFVRADKCFFCAGKTLERIFFGLDAPEDVLETT
jgi:hypothetical protein